MKVTQGTLCTLTTLQDQVERFWKIEEADISHKTLTKEERECEELFVNTLCRNEEGRFIVQLPVKENVQDLGSSYDQAFNRLEMIEKRFTRNAQLNQEYSTFMTEYIQLGHMTKIKAEDINKTEGPVYYLPHHAVCKEASTTTKL